jgi:hypothetical protein
MRTADVRAARRSIIGAIFALVMATSACSEKTTSGPEQPAQPQPPSAVTRIFAYHRSDTIAYPATVSPTNNLQGAQVTLGTASGMMPAAGPLSLSTSIPGLGQSDAARRHSGGLPAVHVSVVRG